jgi:hypothetical protein
MRLMWRYLSALALIAGLYCVRATAQAPDNGKRADLGYTPVRLWERPDVRATRVEIKAAATRAVHQHDDVKFHLFVPLTGKLQLTVGSDKPVVLHQRRHAARIQEPGVSAGHGDGDCC